MSEPVLTPFGFRPMGEIKVGSTVISAHGTPAEVLQVYPQGVVPIYKIKFIDGAETRCSADHLWLAHEARSTSKLKHCGGWKLYTTERLMSEIAKGKNMLIPLTEPVQFTRGKSGGKIKPYTLGVILGDGNTTGSPVKIYENDQEIFDNVMGDGYEIYECKTSRPNEVRAFAFRNFSEEKVWLKENDLRCTAEHKYIPEGYKYAPIEERFALIQGLMDTDGYADSRGHIEYSTVSKQLAKDVQWIIWSLGGKATITEKDPTYTLPDGTRKDGKHAYVVYIQTKDNSRLFRLTRKRERCAGKEFNGGYSELKRRIVSIEPCGYEEAQCIRIDEPDGLYVTNDFVVTHNTYSLLLNALRYKDVPGYNCTIFRKNFNQIFVQGGLWDESLEIYTGVPGATLRKGDASWIFRDEDGRQLSKISFSHIERKEELEKLQGSQICAIFFDELTHFEKDVFFYLLSRNRSTCGVKPYVRATCNPDANSWVADFISWWIDPETGYAIPERSGEKRWFVRRGEDIFWADRKSELWKQFGLKTPEEREEPKSVTFIVSSIYDNKALLESNPQYLANLKALSTVDRERLLYGNWKIKPSAGLYFKRAQVEVLQEAPSDITMVCRGWDIAATGDKESGDADYTSGVLMGVRKDRSFVVLDVINERVKAGDVGKLIQNTAAADRAKYGNRYVIRIPQDPGAAGKIVANTYVKMLTGYSVKTEHVTGSKELRATPFASQWQNGNVYVVAGKWLDTYFQQLENFPEMNHDDMVDASADAFNELSTARFSVRNLI